ncbi:hypothetical protein HID58_063546, partial [Brassica napus]
KKLHIIVSPVFESDDDGKRLKFSGDLIRMSNALLDIDPIDLQFPFELKKQISCSLYLANKTDDYVAFKVKTTNPKKYCVRPNTGVVLPRSSSEVLVTMQAQKEAPADMQCKDKFLLQCVVASPGVTAKDVTPEMFSKEAGHRVEETKLRVVYVDPPRPPSPVREGSEEGSSPRASVSDNGASDFTAAPRFSVDRLETQENSPEARALITRLTEEKNSAIQLNNRLQQELEKLKRESKRSQSGGGIPFMYVLLMSKGGSSLKLDNDLDGVCLEKRQAESLRIMEKYPDRIHVIVDKAEKFEIPNIDKKKIKLSSEKAIFIYVDNVLPPTGEILSSTLVVTGLLLTFNLIFFTFVTSTKCPPTTPKHPKPPKKDTAVKPTCPTDTLKLGTYGVSHRCCWLSTKLPCCALLKGIANLEAAVCLCTALKANVLGINLNVSVDLSLLLNYCGKKLRYGLQCA